MKEDFTAWKNCSCIKMTLKGLRYLKCSSRIFHWCDIGLYLLIFVPPPQPCQRRGDLRMQESETGNEGLRALIRAPT